MWSGRWGSFLRAVQDRFLQLTHCTARGEIAIHWDDIQRRRWYPTPVLLPGKSHGQRSLVGFSPWGRQESDTTERLQFHFPLSCTGEGNSNPLQCSCLENPRDGGAWWAAVYWVAQSRTRLKRLSSSSSSRVHHVKCWAESSTSWNQDCQEKYQ